MRPTLLVPFVGGAAWWQRGTHQGRRASPVKGKYIAGPVPVFWMCQAGRFGVKALLVGLALWHIKGLRKTNMFIVSNLMLRDWSIQSDAKSRGLRKLQRAGLIAMERQGKGSPQVTLLVKTLAVEQPALKPNRRQSFCCITILYY
jgi:hypothetical protein